MTGNPEIQASRLLVARLGKASLDKSRQVGWRREILAGRLLGKAGLGKSRQVG